MALRHSYSVRTELLQRLATNLEHALREHLDGLPHIDRISFRVKGIDSFVNKVLGRDPPYRAPLVEVEDQVAGRVIVFFLDDVEEVRKLVHAVFNRVEGEYRRPKQHNVFDYESWQGVFNIPPQAIPERWNELNDLPETFELQIRTLFQHAYAEPQHDVSYKPLERLTLDDQRELAWVAASAWGADQALERVRGRLDEGSQEQSAEEQSGPST